MNITKVPVEALRRASYLLITRVIGHWVRGGKVDYQLSISSKSALKDFQASSDINDPPDWPKFPPQTDRPCSLKSWEAFSDIYPLPDDSPYYTSLIHRIKTQDMPADVIGTPKIPESKNDDSLASDSEGSLESSLLSSLDSSDDTDSVNEDNTTNHPQRENRNNRAISLLGISLIIELSS